MNIYNFTDTDIKWIGKVPNHWQIKKIKFISNVIMGQSPKSEECNDLGIGIPFLQGNAEFGSLYPTEKYYCDSPNKICPKDSILLSVRAPVGALNKADKEYGIGRGLCSIDPNENVYTNYFWYYLHVLKNELAMYSTGSIFDAVSIDEVKNVITFIPPFEEQQSIAAFLDYKTEKIDKLIEKKEQLLKLLEEKRIALITQSVTKGLDPDVEMKPSGVDWLGDIPEHWEVKKLKFVVSEKLKYGANEEAELDDPTLPRYIRITDMAEDGSLRDDTFKSLPENIAEPYLLKDGDILFARSGATVGKNFVYHEKWGKAAYAGYLIRARLKENYSFRYLSYFLQSKSYWDWISSIFIQATIQNVSGEKYANMNLAFPPKKEQNEIVNTLDKETEIIDSLSYKIKEAIDRLREYRTSLITSAVTGKIDVRDFKPERV